MDLGAGQQQRCAMCGARGQTGNPAASLLDVSLLLCWLKGGMVCEPVHGLCTTAVEGVGAILFTCMYDSGADCVGLGCASLGLIVSLPIDARPRFSDGVAANQ